MFSLPEKNKTTFEALGGQRPGGEGRRARQPLYHISGRGETATTTEAVPNGYPNLTRYRPNTIQFWKSLGSEQPKKFSNTQYFGVTPEFRVLSDILGVPRQDWVFHFQEKHHDSVEYWLAAPFKTALNKY